VGGLLAYLYGEGRRNEHVNPRLVASWDGYPQGWEPPRGSDGRYRVGGLARRLETPVRTCLGVSDKPVYHLVLRNAEADRVLSDGEWAEVAAAAMAGAGIAPDGDPAGCKWVAVRHDDTHVHVVATLARQDGRVPDTFGDFKRLRAVCHAFERRWGLTATAPADGTAAGRAGVREQVTAERQRRVEPPRDTLRRAVAAAAAGSRSPEEFVEALRRGGVQVHLRYSTAQLDQVTGYSVSLGGHTDGRGNPIRFGGGKLAPDLSWPKLHARWTPAPAGSTGSTRTRGDRNTGPSADRGPAGGATAGGGFGDGERDRLWEQAQRLVDEAAERIRAHAGGDPDAAADAAWAASDAMRSVAWAAEGAAGGPLSEAAEAFARAGRHTYRRIPKPTDTGHQLRTVARLAAALSAGHPAGRQLALLAALAALARTVAQLRAAQQRAHQAAAARRAAEQLHAIAPPRRADPTRPGGRDDDRRTRRTRDRPDQGTRGWWRPAAGAGDLKPPPRTGGWTRPGPSSGHGYER
jgi:hypothetical protein